MNNLLENLRISIELLEIRGVLFLQYVKYFLNLAIKYLVCELLSSEVTEEWKS